MTSIDGFDEITNFRSGESDKYIVEYILMDDGGFCHRASPFLMPVGTIFEHDFGTYKVNSIDRKKVNIIVWCVRETMKHEKFDTLHKMKENFN